MCDLFPLHVTVEPRSGVFADEGDPVRIVGVDPVEKRLDAASDLMGFDLAILGNSVVVGVDHFGQVDAVVAPQPAVLGWLDLCVRDAGFVEVARIYERNPLNLCSWSISPKHVMR